MLFCFQRRRDIIRHLKTWVRGVSGYLKLGGQVVMWRAAAAARRRLLFCQKLGGQLPTLPTRQLRPWKVLRLYYILFLPKPQHSDCNHLVISVNFVIFCAAYETERFFILLLLIQGTRLYFVIKLDLRSLPRLRLEPPIFFLPASLINIYLMKARLCIIQAVGTKL